jgi:hypothetical protein
MRRAVARGVEWPELFVELATDDGVLAGPLGLLDSVEFRVEEEEEEEVFVLEDAVSEVTPRLVVVLALAEIEEHLCVADECEQREFLRDAGEGEFARLGELPTDHGDGGGPVARKAAVVVVLVALRQVAAEWVSA